MQEPSLLNLSIKDNILYGNERALNSEILLASELSHSLEFIETFSKARSLHEECIQNMQNEYNTLILNQDKLSDKIRKE
jgi:ABC-type multidrug transport system fused ATPase/permease subunit